MTAVIGIVGLGTMGLGVAQVFAQAGFSVLATDAHAPTRDSARGSLEGQLTARVAAGKLNADDMQTTLDALTILPDLTGLGPADMVIEAIVERLEAKQDLFRQLDQIVAPGAVLATNTSSLPVAKIGEGSALPGRVLGLHFFNPAPVMRLVELAGHAGTAAHSLFTAQTLTEQAGKTVITCPDRPGFIVNRCARPFYGEALALLEEGRSAAEIDAAMQNAGYKLGPFGLIDLIGADINLAATEGLRTAMAGHPRYHVFATLATQVAKVDLGRKTGRGFVFPNPLPSPPADADQILIRIEATLINEAAWLLSDGGTTQDGIDTAMRLGLNFPYGPFAALARHGLDSVRQTLQGLERAAPPHLKTRYLPAPLLA